MSPRDPYPEAPPYWLGGEEPCEHCRQDHVREEFRRCAACDGPVCRDCITALPETRELLCPPCSSDHRPRAEV